MAPVGVRRRARDPEYLKRHKRVYEVRGSASLQSCIDCDDPAQEWSQRHGTDGESPDDYDPRCRKCHRKYDTPISRKGWSWKVDQNTGMRVWVEPVAGVGSRPVPTEVIVVKHVMRDPNLQHQIVLENLRGDTGFPTVTCNCRKRAGLEPMGRNQDLHDAAKMYNDPNNHIEPFGQEWEVSTNGQRGQSVQ